jgi:UDP-GlcNAc:undecaprenyl-phosphate/decaprenyl-phosphate GlcNAc-1-phosphate transferase
MTGQNSYLLAAIGSGAVAALLSSLLTPLVRRAALHWGAGHETRARDVHTAPVARWGGLALYPAVVLTAGVVLAAAHWGLMYPLPGSALRVGLGIFLAGTLLTVVGAWDDLRDLSAGRQLLAQIVCALLVIPFGVRIDVFSDPLHPGAMLSLGLWSYPVTLLWIVGVTNAINWIDGLDGLAAGVCAIAALALALMGVQSSHPALGLLAGALCGSLLGFLRYNAAPARIFMGGGALFVGFCLASIAAVGAFKAATAMALLVPVLILGVPIFDSLFVVTRRLATGQAIYKADKSHLHHRLLARGFTQRRTVLILYAVSLGLSTVALLLTLISGRRV